MGKKGKKGSGKNKKATKGSSASSTERKKVEEPKMTMEEARVAFLVNVKRRSCEEFERELEKLKFDNEGLKEKNKRLKAEQMEYVKSLVAQMKERDAEVAQAATVARDHVEEAVREKLQAAKDSENDIREMKQRIEVVKLETEELRREVRRREHYKDVGQHKDQEEIALLNETLDDWQRDIEETDNDLKKSLKITRKEITKQAEQEIGMQKHTAAEYAISRLEPSTRKQIVENERLHREIKMHTEAVAQLRSEVEDLEKRNLDMLTVMMNSTGDEIAIATQFYMPDVEAEGDGEVLALTLDGEDESTDEEDGQPQMASLYVTGKGLKTENSQGKGTADDEGPAKWPVTAHMLRSVLSTS